MKRIKMSLAGMLFSVMLVTSSASTTQASGLEVVFRDTMWGASLGAILGLATWAFDDNETSEAGRLVLRGAAIGTLAGMVYGFYDAHRLGFVSKEPIQEGLVHYDAQKHQLRIGLNPLAHMQYHQPTQQQQAMLFSAAF